MRDKLQKSFDLVIEVVFGVILVFLILGTAIGTFQLAGSVWKLIAASGGHGNYVEIITDVLTLYVMVELTRSLVEYFNSHRIRLTFIIDAGIVFVLREILIGLFKHQLEPSMIYALSALMFVLGALRIGSVLVYQREKTLFDTARKNSARD